MVQLSIKDERFCNVKVGMILEYFLLVQFSFKACTLDIKIAFSFFYRKILSINILTIISSVVKDILVIKFCIRILFFSMVLFKLFNSLSSKDISIEFCSIQVHV